MKLAQLQREFINYLTHGDDQLAAQVQDGGTIDVATRLHIYANAYRQRLREAIDNDHAVLGVYLGDDLFNSMVQGYLVQYPSSTYSLRYFADHLPRFLADHTPFSDYPIISELALFERRLLDVFDAPDSTTITRQTLSQLPPQRWPGMTLTVHPSVQVFGCRWNSVEIWQALKQSTPPPAPVEQGPRHWLMWRNSERLSEFNSLSRAQYEFLMAALAGKPFSYMCEQLLPFCERDTSGEDQASQLALETLLAWLDGGMITRLNTC